MGTTAGVDPSAGQATVPFSADAGASNTSMAFEGGGAVPGGVGSTSGGGSGFMEAFRNVMKDPAVMKELSNLGSKYAGLMAADGKMSPNTRAMLGQIMQGGGKRGPGGGAGLAEETEGINRMALASGMTQFLTPEMASQMLRGVGIPADRARFG